MIENKTQKETKNYCKKRNEQISRNKQNEMLSFRFITSERNLTCETIGIIFTINIYEFVVLP